MALMTEDEWKLHHLQKRARKKVYHYRDNRAKIVKCLSGLLTLAYGVTMTIFIAHLILKGI